MRKYPCDFGEIFTPDGDIAPDGEYVPAEVAERLLAELVTTLQWFSDFGSIADSPMAVEASMDERMMAIEAALKYADGEEQK